MQNPAPSVEYNYYKLATRYKSSLYFQCFWQRTILIFLIMLTAILIVGFGPLAGWKGYQFGKAFVLLAGYVFALLWAIKHARIIKRQLLDRAIADGVDIDFKPES